MIALFFAVAGIILFLGREEFAEMIAKLLSKIGGPK